MVDLWIWEPKEIDMVNKAHVTLSWGVGTTNKRSSFRVPFVGGGSEGEWKAPRSPGFWCGAAERTLGLSAPGARDNQAARAARGEGRRGFLASQGPPRVQPHLGGRGQPPGRSAISEVRG